MEDRSIVEEASHAARLREAISPLLPLGPSLIPLDILLAVTKAFYEGRPLTIARLTEHLPYSVTGIRYNMRLLVEDDWLLKSHSSRDRRVIHLQPTAKAIAGLRDLTERVEALGGRRK